MSEAAIDGVVVGFAMFLLTHLVAAIWFAATMKAEVRSLVADMKVVAEAMKVAATDSTRISLAEEKLMRLDADMREARAQILTAAQNRGDGK